MRNLFKLKILLSAILLFACNSFNESKNIDHGNNSKNQICEFLELEEDECEEEKKKDKSYIPLIIMMAIMLATISIIIYIPSGQI